MSQEKDQVAHELVEGHFAVEPELRQVLRIMAAREDEPNEHIKLLEVNAATVATGSVEPFAFGPTGGSPYGTVIAEVTPEEFDQIVRCELPLPRGWSLDDAKTFRRPEAE